MMLPEYRDLISELKVKDKHFARIFQKHNELDQKTTDADEGRIHLSSIEIEIIKKEKLLLKDEALSLILKYKKQKEA